LSLLTCSFLLRIVFNNFVFEHFSEEYEDYIEEGDDVIYENGYISEDFD
jgi:hypothetical protein